MLEFILQIFFLVLQLPVWDASSENMGFIYFLPLSFWVLIWETCQWKLKCVTDI